MIDVTPYQLALLAATMNPALAGQDPVRAVSNAYQLLKIVEHATAQEETVSYRDLGGLVGINRST